MPLGRQRWRYCLESKAAAVGAPATSHATALEGALVHLQHVSNVLAAPTEGCATCASEGRAIAEVARQKVTAALDAVQELMDVCLGGQAGGVCLGGRSTQSFKSFKSSELETSNVSTVLRSSQSGKLMYEDSWKGLHPIMVNDNMREYLFERRVATNSDGIVVSELNQFMSALWPRIDKWIDSLVHSRLEPAINDALPGLLKGGVKFDKFSLGKAHPQLENFFVDTTEAPFRGDAEGSGAIELHAVVTIRNNVEVDIEAMGVHLGIRKLTLSGELVVLFAPLLDRPPFFGAIQIYFPNPPQMSIEFCGFARLANVPGVRSAVRQAIHQQVANVLVLPRRIAVRLGKDKAVDEMDVKHPEPIGILRLRLRHVEGLESVDTAWVQSHVEVMVGLKRWESPAARRTGKKLMSWKGIPATADFPIHNDSQTLSLTVMKSDFAQSDEVAFAKPVHFHCLVGKKAVKLPLFRSEYEEKPLAIITVALELLSLSCSAPVVCVERQRAVPPPSVAHLSFRILDVWDVPDTVEYPVSVRLRVLDPVSPHRSSGKDWLKKTLGRTMHDDHIAEASTWRGRPCHDGALTSTTQGLLPCGACGTTAPTPGSSWRASQALTEQQQQVCLRLHRLGTYSAGEMAQAVSASSKDVQEFIDEGKAILEAEAERQQSFSAAMIGVTNHRFNCVLQLLLSRAPEGCRIEICLLDRRYKEIGLLQLPLQSVLDGTGHRQDGGHVLPGPFVLTGNCNARVVGSMWLRWLVSAPRPQSDC